ncbi:hypothetical protein COA01_30110 [Bacillus cereus]|uniref:hypothetical protein n=1 Tax=Bacillus cereus TaxID=1396 RepID=UPI000BFEA578|nr:hypothetical protein [Bacillus cereus]PGP14610.1 hypothetical protein COA01_30110 [Bacillus cereus]
MDEILSTGEMIHRLEIGQRAKVVANGYVGGIVYKYISPITGYTEIRWEGTENVLKIGGNIFDAKWEILNE